MEGEKNRGTKTYGTHTYTGIGSHDHGGQEIPQSSTFKVEEQEIQSRNLFWILKATNWSGNSVSHALSPRSRDFAGGRQWHVPPSQEEREKLDLLNCSSLQASFGLGDVNSHSKWRLSFPGLHAKWNVWSNIWSSLTQSNQWILLVTTVYLLLKYT